MNNTPLPPVSYNNIIPQDVQNLLLGVRNDLTNNYFTIGDLANALTDTHAGVYEAREIQAAIGHYVGKSARSVRFYQAVSKRISLDLREEFSVYDLGFSHYSLAAQFPGREVEIISWVIDNNASIDAARLHFGKGQPVVDPTPPERIEYKSNGDLFKSLHLHLWRRADTLHLNVDQRARAKKLLEELEELFSG